MPQARKTLTCAGVTRGCWVGSSPPTEAEASLLVPPRQAHCTHLCFVVGCKQQLGSTGQVAVGTSPLGIAATLITLLNCPSRSAYRVGYSKAAGFSQPPPLQTCGVLPELDRTRTSMQRDCPQRACSQRPRWGCETLSLRRELKSGSCLQLSGRKAQRAGEHLPRRGLLPGSVRGDARFCLSS